jgi:hypothetical protein
MDHYARADSLTSGLTTSALMAGGKLTSTLAGMFL